MGKVLGIDLGTTRSVMAVMEGGAPVVIPNAEGYLTTPSVVAFQADGATLVGEPALRQLVIHPADTVRSVKRFIGRLYEDPATAHEREYVSYSLVAAPNHDVWIEARGKTYTPTDISAIILRKLKADAERYLGEPVSQAVVTVPAYFTSAQRQATREAGALAGLQVLRLLNEPTAAALAYGLDKKEDERIVVYDLGGGTFDVTILELGEGVFEVKAMKGDAHLGGDDFDDRVAEALASEFARAHGVDPRADPQAYHRLREAAEQAKIDLSQALQVSVTVPYLWTGASGPAHLVASLSRERLERLTSDLIDRSIDCVALALADAELTPKQIDHVVLAGGMSRMPAIRERLGAIFGARPHSGQSQDEVVAIGAAIQAGVLTGDIRDMLLLDAAPHHLSIQTAGQTMERLIERNTTIPTQKYDVFTTASAGQREVDVCLLEGDDDDMRNTTALALITFDSIKAVENGVPEVEITLDIDANSNISVTCRDKHGDASTRHSVTSAERRLAAPRPNMLPRSESGAPTPPRPEDAPHNDAPAFMWSHYHATELAKTLALQTADRPPVPLTFPGSSIGQGMRLLTAATLSAQAINCYITAGERGVACFAVDAPRSIGGGAPMVLLRYRVDVDSLDTFKDQPRAENARLTLTATDLYSGREWSRVIGLAAPLPAVPQPGDLPRLVRSAADKRPVAPPPVRRAPAPPATPVSAPPPPAPTPPIFVSHTHADNAFCREFVGELRAAGTDVWYDEENMSDGLLLDIVQQELGARPVFLVILSPAALNHSRWVKLEVTMAFQKLLSDDRWRMLPVTAAAISPADLGDHWLALQSLYRVEQPGMRPFEPREAAREALQRLRAQTP